MNSWRVEGSSAPPDSKGIRIEMRPHLRFMSESDCIIMQVQACLGCSRPPPSRRARACNRSNWQLFENQDEDEDERENKGSFPECARPRARRHRNAVGLTKGSNAR